MDQEKGGGYLEADHYSPTTYSFRNPLIINSEQQLPGPTEVLDGVASSCKHRNKLALIFYQFCSPFFPATVVPLQVAECPELMGKSLLKNLSMKCKKALNAEEHSFVKRLRVFQMSLLKQELNPGQRNPTESLGVQSHLVQDALIQSPSRNKDRPVNTS